MSQTATVEMRCSQCGYDLRRLGSRQCPECGEGFDPQDRGTFISQPVRGYRYLGINFLGLFCLLLPFLIAPSVFSAMFIVLPVVGVAIAIGSLWKSRHGIISFHPWVINPGALWLGCIVGMITIVLGFGVLAVFWAGIMRIG